MPGAPPLLPFPSTPPAYTPAPPLTPIPPEGPWQGPQGEQGLTGPQGPQGEPGPAVIDGELDEFLPGVGATFVDLSTTPRVLLMVARGGVVQSVADGNYSLSGSRITFTDAFDGAERVVVSYLSGAGGAGGPAVDEELRLYIQTIMAVLDPGGPPPPSP